MDHLATLRVEWLRLLEREHVAIQPAIFFRDGADRGVGAHGGHVVQLHLAGVADDLAHSLDEGVELGGVAEDRLVDRPIRVAISRLNFQFNVANFAGVVFSVGEAHDLYRVGTLHLHFSHQRRHVLLRHSYLRRFHSSHEVVHFLDSLTSNPMLVAELRPHGSCFKEHFWRCYHVLEVRWCNGRCFTTACADCLIQGAVGVDERLLLKSAINGVQSTV
mmetsp:Transcript_24334/g.63492  ORF Transcript_24334/g.63492 Transcript_24334/m.63492 type:complete len:218 (+) Transcript_24334:310-963(+)